MSEPASTQTTKKRSRYTSVACNECKRRKIKCNGERPCERCGNQSLDCVYESPNFQDSDEYRRMNAQIETLQGQIETLFGMMRQMKAEQERWAANGPAGVVDVSGEPQGADVRLGIEGRNGGSSRGRGEGALLPSGTSSCGPEDVSRAVRTAVDAGHAKPTLGARVTESDVSRMDVDMSRQDGRIDFVPIAHTSAPKIPGIDTNAFDPLLRISDGVHMMLLGIYTQQIHTIYPVLNMADVLWRLQQADTLRQKVLNGAITGRMAVNSGEQAGQSMSADPPQKSLESLNDVEALICKMVLAIAAFAHDSSSAQACQLYDNVQEAMSNQGRPRGWTSDLMSRSSPNEDAITSQAPAIVKGMRLRLLHALWDFQHGNELEALTGAREALRVQKNVAALVMNDHGSPPEVAEIILKAGSGVYAMYWRLAILIQPIPRFDVTIEKIPPRRFDDGEHFDHDEDSPIGLPLFEYAKLCSISSFAFERPERELAALEATKPPWNKEVAVEGVHRWQGNFTVGLKSLACVRPGFLAGRSVEERTMCSAIYLLGHFLRLTICKYKRCGAADRYQGPISELYESAKYAHDSIMVLWNVHEAGKVWPVHAVLYNNFLLNAGAWVYELLQDGAIRLSEEVKNSLQKTLTLMETYCRYWEKSQWLLDKLLESRRYGALV